MDFDRRDTLRLAAFIALAGIPALAGCADAGDAPDGTAELDTATTATADTQAVVVSDGLNTPESVLHDPEADVYLVSNIDGAPTEKDGNGYISRIRPDGTAEDARWIDGEADGVTLHAPKGLALKGDTLFVADIDTVRAFSRETGEPLGAVGVENASFLNDLAVGDGVLYVSDMGVDASFSPDGGAGIYRFGEGGAERVAEDVEIESPNGITVAEGSLWVVTFAGGEVHRVPLEGDSAEVVATLPGGQLDGIVRRDDGSLLVSSWETSTVYLINADGTVEPLVEDVESPADIGYDTDRDRVLIPLFNGDRVEARPVR